MYPSHFRCCAVVCQSPLARISKQRIRGTSRGVVNPSSHWLCRSRVPHPRCSARPHSHERVVAVSGLALPSNACSKETWDNRGHPREASAPCVSGNRRKYIYPCMLTQIPHRIKVQDGGGDHACRFSTRNIRTCDWRNRFWGISEEKIT